MVFTGRQLPVIRGRPTESEHIFNQRTVLCQLLHCLPEIWLCGF